MNASTVLVLVERHKLEQDADTGMQLALGHYVNRVLPKCKLHTCCCTVQTGTSYICLPHDALQWCPLPTTHCMVNTGI